MSQAGGAFFESRFQSFAEQGGPAHVRERVERLRARLAELDLAGFIVPRADEHQNEYVPACAERLMWLTGFSGSAGIAVVLARNAAIFIDGRYTVQAPAQVDGEVIATVPIAETSPSDWIESHVRSGERLGYDPWLHTPEAVERFESACARVGAKLAPLPSNPIDEIWIDRPAGPLGKVTLHARRLAGEDSSSKLKRVGEALKTADGILISDPHNVAWLFNIRGADVSHTPLPLCFAYAPKAGKPTLFIDDRKLTPAVRAKLSDLIDLAESEALVPFIESLAASGAKVAFDATTSPMILVDRLNKSGGKSVVGLDPITLMKACKNRVEIEGARSAHERDGAALCRFLAWFDGATLRHGLTEISAAQALETFRRETGKLKDISFPTISAAGPHAAIPHYRVSEVSSLKVTPGLFLIDSGGQYEDGTTDITRTIVVRKVGRLEKDRFTRVLKGHIAIARAVFPKGTNGAQIDMLARQALWNVGLDFDHGAGHGVGSYLSVHEGPQRIAKTGVTPLRVGMILSNEPGYYAAGCFGIRIENLLVVEPREVKGAEREMLGFETISLAPIDLRAIDVKLLDAGEIDWLNKYHARVRSVLSPQVDKSTRTWLAGATRKLSAVR